MHINRTHAASVVTHMNRINTTHIFVLQPAIQTIEWDDCRTRVKYHNSIVILINFPDIIHGCVFVVCFVYSEWYQMNNSDCSKFLNSGGTRISSIDTWNTSLTFSESVLSFRNQFSTLRYAEEIKHGSDFPSKEPFTHTNCCTHWTRCARLSWATKIHETASISFISQPVFIQWSNCPLSLTNNAFAFWKLETSWIRWLSALWNEI